MRLAARMGPGLLLAGVLAGLFGQSDSAEKSARAVFETKCASEHSSKHGSSGLIPDSPDNTMGAKSDLPPPERRSRRMANRSAGWGPRLRPGVDWALGALMESLPARYVSVQVADSLRLLGDNRVDQVAD